MNKELGLKNNKWKIVNRKFQHGFTLVELLIVIAIIGVLSAILLANFVGVRQRARDAQRKSDFRQIQSALELYRADQGSYPSPAGISPNFSLSATCGSSLQSGLVVYLQKIPCNPNPPGDTLYSKSNGNYYYLSNGTTYELDVCLENTNDSDPNIIVPASGNCPTVGGTVLKAYQLKNP